VSFAPFVLLLLLGGAAGATASAPAPSVSSPGPTAAPPAVLAGWEAVADGVSLRHDDDCDGDLFRFDLRRFSASVVVPGPRQPLTAARARAEGGPGTVLAINGGFFDTAGASLGLRIVNGKVIQKLRPRVDWGVLLLREGMASLIHSREYVPDAADLGAIQVGPRLVVAGQVTQLKPQSARRTAVAVDRSGRFLTIAVTRARVEATVLAEKLARLGAWSALMFDGGPSTQLSFALGQRSIELTGGYAVPDLLLLRTR
jgi:hypothetical protein